MKIHNVENSGSTQRPEDEAVRAAELILSSVGEDLNREGLERTPQRFAKALRELTSGMTMTAKDAAGEGVFAAEGPGLVSVRDVEYYSMCEHHMLPFWGTVNVAYYPRHKIVGLSKIPRIVDVFARRLQVQERLTKQIADGLHELVDARAVAVRVRGCHMCMQMRGVKKSGSETITEYSVGEKELSSDELQRLWRAVD